MLCSIIELDEETSEIAMSMISPKLVPADIPLNIIESFTSLVDMIKWFQLFYLSKYNNNSYNNNKLILSIYISYDYPN